MNFEPPFQFTSTPENAYRLALQSLRQPDTYYYFDKILEEIETTDQCLAHIQIEDARLSKVAHHHPASFLKNLRQAKVDLLWHKYSELKSIERQKLEEQEKYKNKRNFCNKVCRTSD